MPDLDYSEDDRETNYGGVLWYCLVKGLVALDFCSASAPSGWIIAMTSVESFVSVCFARLKRLGGRLRLHLTPASLLLSGRP